MSESFTVVYRTAGVSDGFPFWGAVHLTWLGVLAVLCAALCVLARRGSEKTKKAVFFTLTALLLLDEAAKHVFLFAIGEQAPDYLPLHLCSIGLFVCLWYALRPNPWAGELLFAVSLPGALIALAFPGWADLPASSFLAWHSFTFHILLALIPIFLLASGELKPNAKRLWFCALFLLVTAIPIWFVDRRFGTNFYFLTYPGRGNPLGWFEKLFGNPGYQIGLPILAGAFWLAEYGILALLRRSGRAKSERRDAQRTERAQRAERVERISGSEK